MKIIFIFLLLLIQLFIQSNIWAGSIADSYRLEKKRMYVEALKIVERIAIIGQYHYLAHLRAGWLAYLSGNLTKSIYYYQKAVALAPDAIEPRLGLMLPLLALGHYEKTQTIAMSVLRMDAKNYFARKRLAFALYMLGKYSNAQRYYNSLVRDYPADGQMYLGLAWTYYFQQKRSKALAAFKQAGLILPDDPRVSTGLKLLKK